jgi:phosphatidylethanolamine-binding protein (PEBP) family uncharacterized protein
MDVALPKLKIAFFLFCTTTFSLAFDSRNISSTEWICGGVSSSDSVFVTFEDVTPPGPNVECGTEVFQNVTSAYQSASMPTISYDAADASLLYTVLIVDRDASSAANPTRSPIIHMAIGNVAGEVLFSSGLSPSTISDADLVFQSYSGPQPPPLSLCHRYYVMLYSQDSSVTPQLNVSAMGRFNFDFPTWASTNKLTKLAVNYFRTQSNLSRTGGCDDPSPSPSPGKSGASALVVNTLVSISVAVASLMLLFTC